MKIRVLLIAVIALFVILSWKMVLDTASEKKEAYQEALEDARTKAELGISADAYESYANAILNQDSVEVRSEFIDYLFKNNDYESAEKEILALIDTYPKEAKGYEYLCQYSCDTGDMSTFFTTVRKVRRRGIASEKIDKLYSENEFAYKLGSTGYYELSPYSSGFASYTTSKGWMGYVSESGELYDPLFTKASAYSSAGVAVVQDETGETFVINTESIKKHVDSQHRTFTDFTAFTQDCMAVCENGKYRYVDIDFNTLIEGKTFDGASAFNGGFAVVKNGDKWQIINDNQEYTSSTTFDDFVLDEKRIAFRAEIAIAKIGDSYYIVDSTGNKVSTTGYEDAKLCMSDGKIPVKSNGLWGFVDNTGAQVFSCQFEDARPFTNGYAAVKVDGSWGFIDANGTMVIEPTFLEAYDLSTTGRAPVLTESGWRIMRIYNLSE